MTMTHWAGVRRAAFALCFAAVCAGAPGMKAQAAAPAHKPAARSAARPAAQSHGVEALFVSDIHFEPFWDPAKAARLKAAPVSEWKAILAGAGSADREAAVRRVAADLPCARCGYLGHVVCIESAGDTARCGRSEVCCVERGFDGARVSVQVRDAFPKAAPGEYRAFTEKTIEYVMRELRGALPGVPVYAALGNNDSDCGDYQMDADSAFLAGWQMSLRADFAAADRDEARGRLRGRVLQRDAAGADGAHADAGAGRSVYVAAIRDVRGKADPAPAAAQIVWMEQQLDAARRSKRRSG